MKKIIAVLGDYYHDKLLLKKSLNKAIQRLKTEESPIKVEYIEVMQLPEKLRE